MKSEYIYIRLMTYKLKINEKYLRGMRPYFKVKSESQSQISKTIKHPMQGEPKFEEELKLRKRDNNIFLIELWDRVSNQNQELIGRGRFRVNNLSHQNSKFKEWVPIYDKSYNKVGKVLVKYSYSSLIKRSEGIQDRSVPLGPDQFDHNTFMKAVKQMEQDLKKVGRPQEKFIEQKKLHSIEDSVPEFKMDGFEDFLSRKNGIFSHFFF